MPGGTLSIGRTPAAIDGVGEAPDGARQRTDIGLTIEPSDGQAGGVPTPPAPATPGSVDEVVARLAEQGYLCDRRLATAILVALRIGKPLFLEGEAGVGKTEAARAMAAVLGARLIRLQCYEGIDLAHAVYEWNYPRQLLHIRLMGEGQDRRVAEREIFSSEFLLRRPLLDAIDNDDPTP